MEVAYEISDVYELQCLPLVAGIGGNTSSPQCACFSGLFEVGGRGLDLLPGEHDSSSCLSSAISPSLLSGPDGKDQLLKKL